MSDFEPIQLNAEESERFNELLENPPAPNEALVKAMAKHKQKTTETDKQ